MEKILQVTQTRETPIARDLTLNLERLLSGGQLEPKEALLALLATSRAVGHEELVREARTSLLGFGLSPEEIQEAEESAALMGMLNTYYKFRTFIGTVGEEKKQDYRAAGLRMQSLARPVLGKEIFEMLAFAVSVVNGCESCVVSHEGVLRAANVSAEKIHDLARMAAVVKALRTLVDTTKA